MPRMAAILTLALIVGLTLAGNLAYSQSTSMAPLVPGNLQVDFEPGSNVPTVIAAMNERIRSNPSRSHGSDGGSLMQTAEQFRPVFVLAGLILLPILAAEVVLIVSSRRRGRGDFVSRLARNQPFAVFGIGHTADPTEYRGIRRRGRFYSRRLRVVDFGRKYPPSAPRRGTRIPEVGDLG